MPEKIVKVVVSAATYWIDRPYDYCVPEEYAEYANPGCRVLVPFSRGNRICEGIIIAISDDKTEVELKSIARVIDTEPVLTHEQIQLALFMRERYFCTVYDAVKAMLPAGLWLDENGKKRVSDKYIETACLDVSVPEAADIINEKSRRAPQQAKILSILLNFDELSVSELLFMSGASRTSLKALEKSGYIKLGKKEIFRKPSFKEGRSLDFPSLNSEQSAAFDAILSEMHSNKGAVSLLHGITASGKTAVYISLIREVLKEGKSAVFLVPEIALTPQMLETFSSYFPNEIAVIHSSLSSGERYDEWKRIKNGQAHVVIGTRSAVFCPVSNPGIFIIDEEQEESYKSENSPRYNAREVAIFRCYKAPCLLLLGSATPDVCTRYNAEIGRYSYHRLSSRYNKKSLPDVKIVDMKEELRSGNTGNISSYLKDEIELNLSRGEQSILFLNRRGANKFVTCGACGFIYKCPNCSVSLTYHNVGNKLMCHYCGYSSPVGESCPDCGAPLKYIGAGTQLIEKELNELFPDVKVLRMDTDVLSSSRTHEQIFNEFKEEKIPIMIGTQMVTKGLNFENVTLVGVISADQSLYSGDYRASEKTFSLITQVIGRSGRGDKQGRAVIQTYTPENDVIIQASAQDYDDFYNSEIALRKVLSYPPYSSLLAVTVSGLDEEFVVEAADYVKKRLEFVLKDFGGVVLLGPVPLNIVKLKNRFRYRVFIKFKENNKIRHLISAVVCEFCSDKNFRGITFYAENDVLD